MNNDKMIQFVKRWRSLETQRKDLDYATSQWAHDLRDMFDAGKSGDSQFGSWLIDELGLGELQIKELLARALAFTCVADEKTWAKCGGYKAVRLLIDLPKRTQAEIIGVTTTSGRSIRNVIADRRAPAPSKAAMPSRAPMQPAKPRPTPEHRDAEILAAYIARHMTKAPRHIEMIVQRYLVEFDRKPTQAAASVSAAA